MKIHIRPGNICSIYMLIMLLISLFFFWACTNQPSSSEQSSIVFENVNIIDGANALRTDRTVVITGNTITQVGSNEEISAPRGAVIVDGSGKYLIRGLWDSHVHLTYNPDIEPAMFSLFIVNGITSIRDIGGLLHKVKPWKRNRKRIQNHRPELKSPLPVHLTQVQAIESIQTDFLSYRNYVYNPDYLIALRKKMADFIGAKSTEMAFTNNTTEGMVFGTMGPDMKRGDEILYHTHDHSAVHNPIKLRAAREELRIKIVNLNDLKFHPPKNPDDLLKVFEASITSRTKLLSFCHVNYTDGCVLPVKEICAMARSKGVMTLVDGAQATGMMKLDMRDLGCDMYAGPCHKWMLASMYTGFFYVREDVLDRIWPTVYSGDVDIPSQSGPAIAQDFFKNYDNPEWPGAARFEKRGSHNYATRVSIEAAIDFHNDLTPDAIEARVRYMAQKLIKGLRAIDGVEVFSSDDPLLSCGLVSFRIKDVPTEELRDMLFVNHNIYIRNVTKEEFNWDANRASLHIMVTDKQVDRLLGAVEEIAKG